MHMHYTQTPAKTQKDAIQSAGKRGGSFTWPASSWLSCSSTCFPTHTLLPQYESIDDPEGRQRKRERGVNERERSGRQEHQTLEWMVEGRMVTCSCCSSSFAGSCSCSCCCCSSSSCSWWTCSAITKLLPMAGEANPDAMAAGANCDAGDVRSRPRGLRWDLQTYARVAKRKPRSPSFFPPLTTDRDPSHQRGNFVYLLQEGR